jgi:hypothetical protein
VDNFIFPEDARLPKHGVHQGGLAVVNVGDNGNVANIFLHFDFIPFLKVIDLAKPVTMLRDMWYVKGERTVTCDS